MYSACIFCHRSLGSNQTVEHFPIGRRIAFDPEKGRLWVICAVCGRWNLSPFEERWEALEECERLYRGTRLRTSTENIGLGVVGEGIELIRIGRPYRPEFAAWRYAGGLIQRRRRAALALGVGSLAVAGVVTGTVALAGAGIGLHFFGRAGLRAYSAMRDKLNPPPHVRSNEGDLIRIPYESLGAVRIRHTSAAPGWELTAPYGKGQMLTLSGRPAEAAAAVLIPRINRTGATKSDVRTAVKQLEMTSSPADYFVEAEFQARKRGFGYNPIAGMPKPIRIALEMASHEESERRALEGELWLLEQAWKDAESIAAIADNLTIPAHADEFIRRHRDEPQ